AEVCAKSGIDTTLSDVSKDLVDKGVAKIEASLKKAVEKAKLSDAEAKTARGRLRTATDQTSAPEQDLIVEAVPEDMALKKKIFGDLSRAAPGAIFGSNTSSLSLTELAAAAAVPAQVIGL